MQVGIFLIDYSIYPRNFTRIPKMISFGSLKSQASNMAILKIHVESFGGVPSLKLVAKAPENGGIC